MDISYNDKNGIGVLSINGRLDAASHHELEKTFKQYLKETSSFIFDMSNMEYIDSTGLGAIVSCLKSVVDKEGDIKLANIQAKPMLVFNITRTHQIFDIFDDVESALTALQ